MLTCSKCGTKNAQSAQFCMECGNNLSPGEAGSGTVDAGDQSLAPAPTPTTNRCPHCGTAPAAPAAAGAFRS